MIGRLHAHPGRARGRGRADRPTTARGGRARVLVAGAAFAVALGLPLIGCGAKEPVASAETAAPGATGPGGAPAPAAPGGGSSGAAAKTDAGAPAAAGGSPETAAAASAASARKAAPGTQSIRFIVRAKETGAEIPAGSFDVRLIALDPIRDGTAGGGDGAGKGPGAGPGSFPGPGADSPASPRGVSVDTAPEAGAGSIGKAAPAPPTAGGGAPYQGKPEQVLVTQPGGEKWTFMAGVKPGTYAMRITAKGRRMLLEVLTVRPQDKLVERALEPE